MGFQTYYFFTSGFTSWVFTLAFLYISANAIDPVETAGVFLSGMGYPVVLLVNGILDFFIVLSEVGLI